MSNVNISIRVKSQSILTGTSNQKSLDANKNMRAKLNTFKFQLSVTKISLQVAFVVLAVPNSLLSPKMANGNAIRTRAIIDHSAAS